MKKIILTFFTLAAIFGAPLVVHALENETVLYEVPLPPYLDGSLYAIVYGTNAELEMHTSFQFQTDAVICEVQALTSQNGDDTTGTWEFSFNIETWKDTYTSTNAVAYADMAPYGSYSTSTWVFNPCIVVAGNATTTSWWTGAGTWADIAITPFVVSTSTSETKEMCVHQLRAGSDTCYPGVGPLMAWYGTADMALMGAFLPPADLEEDFGPLGNFIRDVLKWLFTPSSQSLAIYNEGIANINTKIPFGLFATASSTFAELGDETTTTTSLGFTVSSTAGDVASINEVVEVFNPAAIEESIPAGLLATIRTIATVAFWMLFFMWIWAVATNSKGGEDV